MIIFEFLSMMYIKLSWMTMDIMDKPHKYWV